MSYLVIDLETTDDEVFGRRSNPFHNKILTVGIKTKYDLDCYELTETGSVENINQILELSPNDLELLIGHNIKFDLLFLWRSEWLQEFFRKGGKIWDTALVEYILTGQRHKYPALRDIAVNKYNCEKRVKNIQEYYRQGKKTKDIPIELLLEDVKNDVVDTEKVYLSQQQLVEKFELCNLIRTQMDFLLATTEMEYNGFYVNKQEWENNKKVLEREINIKIDNLKKVIRKYWICEVLR